MRFFTALASVAVLAPVSPVNAYPPYAQYPGTPRPGTQNHGGVEEKAGTFEITQFQGSTINGQVQYKFQVKLVGTEKIPVVCSAMGRKPTRQQRLAEARTGKRNLNLGKHIECSPGRNGNYHFTLRRTNLYNVNLWVQYTPKNGQTATDGKGGVHLGARTIKSSTFVDPLARRRRNRNRNGNRIGNQNQKQGFLPDVVYKGSPSFKLITKDWTDGSSARLLVPVPGQTGANTGHQNEHQNGQHGQHGAFDQGQHGGFGQGQHGGSDYGHDTASDYGHDTGADTGFRKRDIPAKSPETSTETSTEHESGDKHGENRRSLDKRATHAESPETSTETDAE